MTNKRLWLYWSWRDLRERWLQVTAIALIIALGTSVYSGLGSAAPWRQASYDASYAALNMYDLRMTLTDGSYVDADRAIDAIRAIPHGAQIDAVEPRLIAPTLVEAGTGDDAVLVPGRILGVASGGGGPHVNGIHITQGRALDESDAQRDRAILEYRFADYYDLPDHGTLRLSGGASVEYVGLGMTPETFIVISETVGFMDEANYAVVMMPLASAQRITDHPGAANDFVLSTLPGTDLDMLQTEIERALGDAFAGVGASFMHASDDPAHTLLYGDLNGDDQLFKLIAYLFLAGAAFGTFNLASRIVESQRRQIGIGMALGVPPHLLAVRPLLAGAQIAALGVIFGLTLGGLIGALFAHTLETLMPMPVFDAPFQYGIFAQAALLGIVLPFVATLYPVVRAVRVPPVDAIRTGHLVAKGGGLVPLLPRIPLPGKSFTQMPLRNVLRAPRRTFLTLLGVAMAITTLIAMMGMLDTFLATIDASAAELQQDAPDRMAVTLNTFYATTAPQVESIRQSPQLAAAEPVLIIGGELRHGDETLDVSVELVDMESQLWHPTVVKGSLPSGPPGILIAEKAARDLDVQVGDMVTLEHPRRESLFTFRTVETTVQVTGIHANPLRVLTYMPLEHATLMGLQGTTNELYVNPAPGVTRSEVQRELFNQTGVASVRAVSSVTDMLRSSMNLLIGFMVIVVIAVLALAFLIAFNSTSINVDERSREVATMFAFGLPLSTVTRMAIVENLITGILGTVLGVALGYVAMIWMLNERVATMLPDISLTIRVSMLSFALAIVLGVVVVALTPLFSVRKLTRMDLPSTLRVME